MRTIVLAAWTTGLAAQQQPPPQPQQPSPPKATEARRPVKRVRVNLEGFELAKTGPAQSSTQLGGGTRTLSGGDPAALAPQRGRCYTATPVFAWRHASQAQNFEFRLLDESGAVVHRAAVTGRQYRYPAEAPPLQPGVTYAWTVQPQTSMLGGPSDLVSVVRLTAADIDVVSQQLAHPPAGVDAMEWAAQVFTERRLWYDAVAAWSALIERHPTRADLREKRAQVYDQLPATEALADEDVAAAERLRAGAR